METANTSVTVGYRSRVHSSFQLLRSDSRVRSASSINCVGAPTCMALSTSAPNSSGAEDRTLPTAASSGIPCSRDRAIDSIHARHRRGAYCLANRNLTALSISTPVKSAQRTVSWFVGDLVESNGNTLQDGTRYEQPLGSERYTAQVFGAAQYNSRPISIVGRPVYRRPVYWSASILVTTSPVNLAVHDLLTATKLIFI